MIFFADLTIFKLLWHTLNCYPCNIWVIIVAFKSSTCILHFQIQSHNCINIYSFKVLIKLTNPASNVLKWFLTHRAKKKKNRDMWMENGNVRCVFAHSTVYGTLLLRHICTSISATCFSFWATQNIICFFLCIQFFKLYFFPPFVCLFVRSFEMNSFCGACQPNGSLFSMEYIYFFFLNWLKIDGKYVFFSLYIS